MDLLTPSYATPRLDLSGCVLYLPLWRPASDMAGSTIYSYDSYRHSCTVSGALWRPNGYYFDGSNDCINVNSFEVVDMTIISWVKRDTYSTRYDWIVDKWKEVTNERVWQLLIRGTDEITFDLSSDGTGDDAHYTSLTSTGLIDDTNWHCVAVTYKFIANGTSKIIFYKDGLIDPSTTNTAKGPLFVTTENILIGCRNESSPTPGPDFQGLIGGVFIYNRALTPQEIQRNYQATKGRYTS